MKDTVLIDASEELILAHGQLTEAGRAWDMDAFAEIATTVDRLSNTVISVVPKTRVGAHAKARAVPAIWAARDVIALARQSMAALNRQAAIEAAAASASHYAY
jgi:hypothetical protein